MVEGQWKCECGYVSCDENNLEECVKCHAKCSFEKIEEKEENENKEN